MMKNSANGEISRNRNPKWVEKMVEGLFKYAADPTKLRSARLEKRKSQEDVALAVDLSHTTYGDIERGKRPVRKETAERIAEQFSKRVQDLFEKKGKKFIAKK